MCGIIGYIGNKKVDSVLLKGLTRLEYRGYDSAGIATLGNGRLSVLKSPGKLRSLCDLAAHTTFEGHLGIGHTRWATHGDPSERNAHPHTDCTHQLAVVHNGIIENHAQLHSKLVQEGHRFSSDTDTEVLAHLIENYHLKAGHDLKTAVQKTLKEIHGSYAFCVISSKEDERFIAARNGSPLVVGLGQEENFVASDAPAILDHTREMIFLEDYQMVDVSKTGVKVFSLGGEEVARQVARIDWDVKDVSKDGFAHYMLKEIEEQPSVIGRIIRTRLKEGLETSLFDALHFDPVELSNVQRILIQACGTSWHAALVGKFYLEAIAGIPTDVDVSSEFRYRHLVDQPRTLVLSITQSGETLDTLMALRRGKEYGFKTVSICNVLGSTIARESEGVIYTHAGPEIGVASTKAYTAQLAILFLFSLYLAKSRIQIHRIRNSQSWDRSLRNGRQLHSREPQFEWDALLSELETIPEKMAAVIQHREEIQKIAEKYFQCRDFLFLARGLNYPNAYEGALKIKEIAYIHATGHPAGEMKHGPIALIDDQMPVVAIAPDSSVYEKMVSNIQEVKARAGKVIAITTEGNASLSAFADDLFYVPHTHEFLSPLLTVIPLQYLAYEVAILRGTDVDQPRNLAKSVTVE